MIPRTIYLAAPWAHKAEARIARMALQDAGHTVTSDWIDQHDDTANPVDLAEQAIHDFHQVRKADILVILNLAKSEGKATELGVALASGKPVFLVGPRTINIFYHMPAVHQVDTVQEVIDALHFI